MADNARDALGRPWADPCWLGPWRLNRLTGYWVRPQRRKCRCGAKNCVEHVLVYGPKVAN